MIVYIFLAARSPSTAIPRYFNTQASATAIPDISRSRSPRKFLLKTKEIMARKVVSLDDQLSKFPAHLLDIPCAESNLGKLVHMIDTESMVLMAIDSLGVTDVEVKDVREIWPNKPAVQRLEMFKIWQQKNQSLATYRYVCVYTCTSTHGIGMGLCVLHVHVHVHACGAHAQRMGGQCIVYIVF